MNATRLPSKAFRSLRTILLSERMSICRTIWHARMIRLLFLDDELMSIIKKVAMARPLRAFSFPVRTITPPADP